MQEDSENFVKEISKLVDFVITGSLREDLDKQRTYIEKEVLENGYPVDS